MTSFWTLFKAMFKQKSKPAYLIILIQAVAALATVFLTMLSGGMQDPHINDIKVNVFIGWVLVYIGIFLMYSFFANGAYIIMTAWKNEKINRSQTWRLVPLSDGEIYICNTLSSFVSFVYLHVMQAIVGVIGGIIAYCASNDVRRAVARVIKYENEVDHWHISANLGDFLLLVLFMILIGLMWYVMISFLHFTTRAVIDFLPFTSNKFLIFIIRLVVLIAVIYFMSFIFNLFGELGANPWYFKDNSFSSSLWPGVIELLVLNIGLGAINYFLVDKFVEAKQNN